MTAGHRDGRLARLVDSGRFNGVIAGVIVANAVVLGLETYPGVMAAHGSLLISLNALFYGVFVVELVLRLASYGRRPQDFFRSGWNVFDLVIIGAAALPVVREQTQLLRLLRLARVVRLVRFLPDARILILTVVKSLPSVFSTLVLTFVLMFVYGMTGWSLFGQALPETWGTIGQSMVTLFILLTLENFPTYLSEAEAVSPFAQLFFISYVVLAAFIVFNLLIGIVIASMEKARQHEAEERPRAPDAHLVDRISEIQTSLRELQFELSRRTATPADGEAAVRPEVQGSRCPGRPDQRCARVDRGIELQQVAGLAFENSAHRLQRAEADGLRTTVLQHGHVGRCQPHTLGELTHAHLAFGQLDVEPHDDGHQITASMSVRNTVALRNRARMTTMSSPRTVTAVSRSNSSIGAPGSSAWDTTKRKSPRRVAQAAAIDQTIASTQRSDGSLKMRSSWTRVRSFQVATITTCMQRMRKTATAVRGHRRCASCGDSSAMYRN